MVTEWGSPTFRLTIASPDGTVRAAGQSWRGEVWRQVLVRLYNAQVAPAGRPRTKLDVIHPAPSRGDGGIVVRLGASWGGRVMYDAPVLVLTDPPQS